MSHPRLLAALVAGVIGGIVSIAVAVALTLALLLPGQAAITLYCLSTPISLLLSVAIGVLATWLLRRRTQEKLTAGQAAPAGALAGAVATIVGIVSLPLTQALQNALKLQDRIIEVALLPSRMMGLSPEQLEMARAQIVATQQGGASNTMLVGMATGLVCGLIGGVVLGAGGAALGALVLKPGSRPKLVCQNCGATFELGRNAMIEVRSAGAADLVDYANWDDLAAEARKQQRAVIDSAFSPTANPSRQWQCGMCKAVQGYPQPAQH